MHVLMQHGLRVCQSVLVIQVRPAKTTILVKIPLGVEGKFVWVQGTMHYFGTPAKPGKYH